MRSILDFPSMEGLGGTCEYATKGKNDLNLGSHSDARGIGLPDRGRRAFCSGLQI